MMPQRFQASSHLGSSAATRETSAVNTTQFLTYTQQPTGDPAYRTDPVDAQVEARARYQMTATPAEHPTA